jgi:hypothetical protein
LCPRAPRKNGKVQEKAGILHSQTITPIRMPPPTQIQQELARAGNICNSVSNRAGNSGIHSVNPAKSALLQIQWYLHEPSSQPQ